MSRNEYAVTFSHPLLMACTLILGISLHLLFLANNSMDGQPSLEMSSHAIMMSAQEIDPEEYHLSDISFLEPTGFYKWIVHVKS
jgi:hypothetical protein